MRSKSMKHMYLLTVFILLVSQIFVIPGYGKVETPQKTKEQRNARMKWWRNARFGMFIHWGLYAIPAGEWKGNPIPDIGEWIMLHAKIPTEEYEPLKDKFNPVEFDADRWVRIAKKTGMKYIAITTKHHDGFCLFDSKYTDYDIMNTPFKRDIMKELSDACRRHGLKIGWYYSLPDWHHSEFPSKHNVQNFHGSPNPDADLEKYLEYLKNQVREIFTNYGPIDIMWFDGGGSFDNMEERARLIHAYDLVDYVRSLQPDIIINDRLGIPADYGTPEQHIPDTGIPGRDWETNMTMNDTWGFKKDDHNWKSSEDLIRKLTDISSKGGNYLLNVGPTALGEIPQPSIERLNTIGKWMKVNGEAIYGIKASPFEAPPWGRYTQKALLGNITRLYLHVFDWPVNGKVVVKGLSNQAKYAFLLADPDRHSLEISQNENELIIHAPERAPDPVNSVIAVDVVGKVSKD